MDTLDLWDKGEEFFSKLESNPYFKWDLREQFSLSEAKKVISMLCERDVTGFVAQCYVNYLIRVAFSQSKVTLEDALLNEGFIEYSRGLLDYKIKLESSIAPAQDEFYSSLSSRLSKIDITLDISENQKVLLLRDAVAKSTLKPNWVYSNNQPYQGSISVNDTIYRYESFSSLELDIRNHALSWGFHYVCVDKTHSKTEEHSNVLLFVSPTHAVWFSNLSWDFFNSTTSTNDRHNPGFRLEAVTEINVHFPSLDSAHAITDAGGNNKHRICYGKLSSLPSENAVWLLMCMELIGRRLPMLQPDADSICSSLLLGTGRSKLPVELIPPFHLSHYTIEEAINAIGVHESPMADLLLSLLSRVTLKHCLPTLPFLGFDLDNDKAEEEYPFCSTELSRYGRKPNHLHMDRSKRGINLYPVPTEFIGNEGQTIEVFNKVITTNLSDILNEKLKLWVKDSRDEVHSFINNEATKRVDKHGLRWVNAYLDAAALPPKGRANIRRKVQSNVAMSVEDSRRYSIGHECTGQWYGYNPSESAYIHDNKRSNSKTYVGYFSGSRTPNKYYFAPSEASEWCEFFGCRMTTLPKYLQLHVRHLNHGMIYYPWNCARGASGVYGVLLFY